jgi:hypothetical protein
LILFYFIFISNVKHFVSIQQMFPFGKRLCLFNPLFACFPFLFFFFPAASNERRRCDWFWYFCPHQWCEHLQMQLLYPVLDLSTSLPLSTILKDPVSARMLINSPS